MPEDNNGWFCNWHGLVALGSWMPLGICTLAICLEGWQRLAKRLGSSLILVCLNL